MNIAEALERDARPVLVVPPSERLMAWPQLPGRLVRVNTPAAIRVHPGTAPAWETARRLVEDDE